MYSHLPNNRLKSALSGREYSFTPDPDGSSKRAAIRQLEADDRDIRTANNQRARAEIGRDLTEKEHLQGNWQPDKRTLREKVAEETIHNRQPTHDPNKNHHATWAADLESQLVGARGPQKAILERALEVAKKSAAEFDQRQAERQAFEAHRSSPGFRDAEVYGQAWVARLETNGTVPQAWVDGAKARLEQLKITGDIEAFWTANDAFEAERQATLKQKTMALDAEAAAVRAEAAAVRREAKQSTEPEAVVE